MYPPSRPQADLSPARCPRCGLVFECGRERERFDCWCASMPKLPAHRLTPGLPCLCAQCLAAELAASSSPPPG
ncbi:MAG TPA: cysteine-rich CWC family protein [Trinickia sp.]|nr:cysteine-rich CWC family protein [Trinickia sp.]